MTKITPFISANHCDVSETLSPASVGGDIASDADAADVYAALFPRVALIGGMDQANTLQSGTRADIEHEVQRLFRLFGQQGGYILSACDHFFDVPPANLKFFANAARTCVYT